MGVDLEGEPVLRSALRFEPLNEQPTSTRVLHTRKITRVQLTVNLYQLTTRSIVYACVYAS